ncbi:MAG TPA: hypothetical protein VMT17_01265 [Anaeromyxobacteraceae bacterium]|nr:hypothetical protein [Anaeromyxobacteraceae bacterium]
MYRAVVAAFAAALAIPAAAEPAADVAKAYRLVTGGSAASLAVGEHGTLVVAFEPIAKGAHVDPKAPLKIRVETSTGLRAEKPELRRVDAVDPKADDPRFEIPVTGVAAGAQHAKVAFDFFVCTESACVKQAKVLEFAVQVR